MAIGAVAILNILSLSNVSYLAFDCILADLNHKFPALLYLDSRVPFPVARITRY
jgi:hypothetical protein